MVDNETVKRVLRDMASAAPLTASRVVLAAASVDHPLHDRFLWDDTEAAHQYRLGQARTLIVNVMERPKGTRQEIPVFIHVPARTGGEGEYVRSEVLVQRPDQLRLAQDQAVRYLKGAEDSVERMVAAISFHGGTVPANVTTAKGDIARARESLSE